MLCAPVVLHIGPDGTASVDNVRDADRLAQLGVTDVVVRPAVPPQGRWVMGGKPSQGTKKDKRLKANRPKKKW